MLVWACALGILGLSATISCSPQFRYNKTAYRRSEDCNLCYENECLTLDSARCDYYVEADSMLNRDDEDDEQDWFENSAIRKEVDSLMFDLVDKAAVLSNDMECIPYVSRYTDCNKENVCLGCKSCSCDSDGKWNCTRTQQCRTQDPPLNVDHRILVMVMEILIDSGRAKKTKRSVTDIPEDLILNASSTVPLEQMSEWLYGVKPLGDLEHSPMEIEPTDAVVAVQASDIGITKTTEMSAPVTEIVTGLTTTEAASETTNTGDTDYVAFDEVLRSIAVDTEAYNRRKLLLEKEKNNTRINVDYMIMDEDNKNDNTSPEVSDDFAYIVNFIHGEGDGYNDIDSITVSADESTTKTIIDLLESAGQGGNFNETRDFDMYKVNDKDGGLADAFENTNDIIEYNAVNIMKRDVSGITVPKVIPTVTIIVNTTNDTNRTNITDTEETIDLKQNVLTPLNKIINDRTKELEDLKRIKDKLLKYVKSDGEPVEDMEKENVTSNTYFSIYNLAMESGLGVDLRRANPSGYDKYMFKLKSDIFEVIRDIMGVQKHKHSEIPDDLRLLMHAMKRYVYNTNINEGKPKKVKSKKVKNLRRQMEYNSHQNIRRQMQQNFGRCDFISFKDCIVQIIEVIDKDMPKSNALSPLSPAARKIMKYLIKSSYVDEYAVAGLRVHDPNYNLTDELKNIGSKWQEMATNIISSSPFVTLYKMKLLHYVLTLDVSKMNDALALIDFAHSRRMVHTLDPVSDDILDGINAGLTAIHNKIQIIIRYYSQKPNQPTTIRHRLQEETTTNPLKVAIDTRKNKERSFIKHIRGLLKTSKKDIAELLHRKVPKSEIVKHLAKKKLDEISEKRYSEYEETMKRWQKNLELAPRIRRSVSDKFKTRIKNIIPNYLRHKVNPRIKENKKNATANATRKADDRKKKRKALQRERKARRNTTPTTNKISESVKPRITKKIKESVKPRITKKISESVKPRITKTTHKSTTQKITTHKSTTPKSTTPQYSTHTTLVTTVKLNVTNVKH